MLLKGSLRIKFGHTVLLQIRNVARRGAELQGKMESHHHTHTRTHAHTHTRTRTCTHTTSGWWGIMGALAGWWLVARHIRLISLHVPSAPSASNPSSSLIFIIHVEKSNVCVCVCVCVPLNCVHSHSHSTNSSIQTTQHHYWTEGW